MANVNGNWKKRKPIQRNLSLKKIPGQGVRTHDVMKGISFKDKAFRLGSKAKMAGQRRFGKIAKSYAKYGKPTETLFRKTGAAALGVGKGPSKDPDVGSHAQGQADYLRFYESLSRDERDSGKYRAPNLDWSNNPTGEY